MYIHVYVYMYLHCQSLYRIYPFDLIHEKSRQSDMNLKLWRIKWGTVKGHFLNLMVIFRCSYFETN